MTRQTHLQDTTLVDYLCGDLDPEKASGVEAHVANCSDCARALTRHAQLETALYEAAASMPSPVSRTPWRRVGTAAAAVVSMAAALVLAFGAPSQWVELDDQEPVAGASSGLTSVNPFTAEAGCVEQSTPEGIACVETLAVALATFPVEESWDSFSPDDGNDHGSDLNWCAADEDDVLVCVPGDGRSG